MMTATGIFAVFILFTAPSFSMITYTGRDFTELVGNGDNSYYLLQQASAQEEITSGLPFTPFSEQQEQEAVPEEGQQPITPTNQTGAGEAPSEGTTPQQQQPANQNATARQDCILTTAGLLCPPPPVGNATALPGAIPDNQTLREIAKQVGDVHGEAVLDIMEVRQQTNGDFLATQKILNQRLVDTGFITADEAAQFDRIDAIIASNQSILSKAEQVNSIYNELASNNSSSPMAIAIASIASNSLELAQNNVTFYASNQGSVEDDWEGAKWIAGEPEAGFMVVLCGPYAPACALGMLLGAAIGASTYEDDDCPDGQKKGAYGYCQCPSDKPYWDDKKQQCVTKQEILGT
jgi:hypothetical protein